MSVFEKGHVSVSLTHNFYNDHKNTDGRDSTKRNPFVYVKSDKLSSLRRISSLISERHVIRMKAGTETGEKHAIWDSH